MLVLAIEAKVAPATNRIVFAACLGNAAGDRAHDCARLASRHHDVAATGFDHVAPFGAADIL